MLMVVGVLALNYPLISLFDRKASVWGIPLPFLHVFVVWILLILGLAVLAEYRGRRGGSGNSGKDVTDDSVTRVSHDKTTEAGVSAVNTDNSMNGDPFPAPVPRPNAGD